MKTTYNSILKENDRLKSIIRISKHQSNDADYSNDVDLDIHGNKQVKGTDTLKAKDKE